MLIVPAEKSKYIYQTDVSPKYSQDNMDYCLKCLAFPQPCGIHKKLDIQPHHPKHTHPQANPSAKRCSYKRF